MNAISPSVPRLAPASGRALLAVIASLSGCGCAFAATVGGSVVATTNYVYRGLTQTGHGAAAQGDVHLREPKGWYAGAFGSLALSQPHYASDSELNVYLGRAWTWGLGWVASVQYARYLYTDGRPLIQQYYPDYNELQASVSLQGRWLVSAAYTPEISRYSMLHGAWAKGRQWSFEGSVQQPLWRNLSLAAGIGHYDLGMFQSAYWAWRAGAELNFDRLQVSVTHFGTDASAREMFGRQSADGHWALTTAWRF